MNLEKDVREMLSDVMENGRQIIENVGSDDNLFAAGLDSLVAINFVVLVEERYGIELEDQDLLFENYDTISNIVLLLKKYVDMH